MFPIPLCRRGIILSSYVVLLFLNSVSSLCAMIDIYIVHLFFVSCGSSCVFTHLFMTLSKKCRLIEHLCLVSSHPVGK